MSHHDDAKEPIRDDAPPRGNTLCCCPPTARVWVETLSTSIFVENRIEEKRHLETHSKARAAPDLHVNAGANAQPRVNSRAAAAAIAPPGGPPSADGMGASGADAPADAKSDADNKVDTDADSRTVIDEWTKKDQGKVFRTDRYVVHWSVDGCGPLRVRLDLSGPLSQSLDWLEPQGELSAVKNHLLEPPGYQPLDAAPLDVVLTVEDCQHQVIVNKARSASP